MLKKTILALVLSIAALLIQPAMASDADELTSMLQDFLANSDKATAHTSFWADDLVYSSSAGLRFGKADIMAGFESAGEDDGGEDTSSMAYSGEEVDVRLYGDTAVIAFKLVGRPTNEEAGADVMYYYNTGTFLKRDGVWQVVAWQATKIPPQ